MNKTLQFTGLAKIQPSRVLENPPQESDQTYKINVSLTEQSQNKYSKKQILTLLLNACSDAKAQEISLLNVAPLIGVTDYFLIASAKSDRQAQGIAYRIMECAKEIGLELYSEEGLENGQWIVLDFGDVISHVFYGPMRAHYDLDGLWAEAEKIKVKERPSGISVELKAA